MFDMGFYDMNWLRFITLTAVGFSTWMCVRSWNNGLWCRMIDLLCIGINARTLVHELNLYYWERIRRRLGDD